MGLFSGKNLLRGGLGFATGGLSEVGRALNQKPGAGPGYQMKPLADPSQLKPDQTLVDALGGIGEKQQNNLNNIFSKARTTATQDNAARSVGHDTTASPYIENRLATGQTQASSGLRGSLEGILGNTAYEDFQGQQGFDADAALAAEIGRLNKPSTLEEILGGLSGAAGAGGQLYGALGKRGGSSQKPAPGPNLDLYDPYATGYTRYS